MTENVVSGMSHIGIPVCNIENMLEFLCGLGFSEVRKETQPNGEPVSFLVYQGLMLEVYRDAGAAGRAGCIDHIALDVRQIDRLAEELQKRGCRITEGISKLPYWENGIRYFVVEGPEGLKIEYCERL